MNSEGFPPITKTVKQIRNESVELGLKANKKLYFRQLSNDNKENNSKLACILKNINQKNKLNFFKIQKPVIFEVETSLKKKKNVALIATNLSRVQQDFPIYSYSVGRGNNDFVIKEVMSKRKNWQDAEDNLKITTFRWQQTSKDILWDVYNFSSTNVFNHFEFNSELGKKDNLVKNLKWYIDKNGLKVKIFDLVPFTIEFNIQNNQTEMQTQFFRQVMELVGAAESSKELKTEQLFTQKQKKENTSSPSINNNNNIGLNKKMPESICFGGIDKLPGSFVGTKNLWLLKPTCLNRGKGIELVNTFEDFQKTIQKFKEIGSEERIYNKKASFFKKILIQKYCENLLLIDNRKFDIRVWCLVDQNMNIYFCREGYLRMSSFMFNLDKCKDKLIHLTNNAVQKYSDKYSLYEKGNQKSFEELKKYLEVNTKISFESVYSRIKYICALVLKSIVCKLNYNRRKTCFEIFGLDFIVDKEGACWLLEANVNPCLETSSPILEKLIPRMLDDAFKLTIDKIYKCNVDSDRTFPVKGIQNEENIWLNLAEESKNIS